VVWPEAEPSNGQAASQWSGSRGSEKPNNPRCKPAGLVVVERIVGVVRSRTIRGASPRDLKWWGGSWCSEKPNEPRCKPAGFVMVGRIVV
jgi:hypothetical protein